MNWKYFFLGMGAGIAGAFAVKEAVKKENVSPEQILAQAKAVFKKDGPISGSWINMNPETYSKPPLEYRVYKGGISTFSDGKTQLYEFIADASTGTIIEINELQ
ncbi:peptidase M4 [Mesobacillus campisalis]|uniref:Peptidase M4 n=1 Tax=Mesobacillus campisalis TaxID=1408103 RepID=A0A0M2SW64_9BACI|nr:MULTISPECIES: PepSY domain-containing protein [Bacillaceae]KKK38398.1 peptidase M4 [Mesobacillus campisalis]